MATLKRERRITVEVGTFSGEPVPNAGLEVLRIKCGPHDMLFDGGDPTDRHLRESWTAGTTVTFRRMYGPQSAVDPDVHPLGPFYGVHCGNLWRQRIRWTHNWRQRAQLLAREFRLLARVTRTQGSAATANLGAMFLPLERNRPKRVLFAAGLWDPDRAPTPEIAEERHLLNQTRAGVVRALRKEFGERFIGGISRSPFSEKYCPDCLISDQQAHQKTFLANRRRAAIGVATTGLLGSLGFKFGEYLAGSMAIVSEPLGTALPGPIKAGSHFLPFTEIDQCVDTVCQLLSDDDLRYEMMRRNASYFREWARPDRMVARALTVGTNGLFAASATREL